MPSSFGRSRFSINPSVYRTIVLTVGSERLASVRGSVSRATFIGRERPSHAISGRSEGCRMIGGGCPAQAKRSVLNRQAARPTRTSVPRLPRPNHRLVSRQDQLFLPVVVPDCHDRPRPRRRGIRAPDRLHRRRPDQLHAGRGHRRDLRERAGLHCVPWLCLPVVPGPTDGIRTSGCRGSRNLSSNRLVAEGLAALVVFDHGSDCRDDLADGLEKSGV
jgi:hypothetical protein